MRRFLLFVSLLLAPALAEAATCTVTGSHTWTSATQDVASDCTESAADRYVIASGGSLTIPAGTTISVAEVSVSAGGTITVNGRLNLTDCNDANPRTYNSAECGGLGTWNVQGSLIHDSVASGAIFAGITKYTTDARIMRLNFNATPAGGNFAAGDVLVFESGPAKNHQYVVSAVNTAGCATATVATCYIDIELYRTGTQFGTSGYPDTVNYARNAAYPDTSGAPSAPTFNDARIASPRNANFDTEELANKVILCSSGASACVASAAIATNGSYSGWYFAYTNVATGYTTADDLGKRYMILDSQNDVTTPISGETGTVDVLVLAEPIIGADWLNGGNFTSSTLAFNGLIWPGFYPTDSWKLYRPAVLANTGTEPDSSFGIYGSASCANFDYARTIDWLELNIFGTDDLDNPITACKNPMNYVLVQDNGGGDGLELTGAAESGGCNLHALRVVKFDTLVLDHIAIVDSKIPADTSSTCCLQGGGGTPCAGGTGGLEDGATDSGTHGMNLGDVVAGTVSNFFSRYMGDDFIIASNTTDAPTSGNTLRLTNMRCWWGAQGESGQCLDFGSTSRTYVTTATDLVSLNATGANKDGCSYGSLSNGGMSTVTMSVDRAVITDVRSGSPAIYHESSATIGLLSNAFVYARDVDGGTSPRTCSAAVHTNLDHVWINGNAAPVRNVFSYLRNVFWRPEPSNTFPQTLLGLLDGSAYEVTNSVFSGAMQQALVSPVSGTSTLDFRNNFIAYDSHMLGSLGSFADGTTALVSVSGNIFQNTSMLNCSGTTWGAANGSKIGSNIVQGLAGAAQDAITNISKCPGAAVPYMENKVNYGLLEWGPIRPELQFGPRGTVGVQNRSLLDEMDIDARYNMTFGGGGGGRRWPQAF